MTEDTQKQEKKPARREDWQTTPMPEKHDTFVLKRHFTGEEMNVLSLGHIPEEMEDKWFFYMEGPVLWAHRSWTGNCIYRVEFKEDGCHVVTVNRDPRQYGCTDIGEDLENLNELLGRWANDPYDHYKEFISETHRALKKARRIK